MSEPEKKEAPREPKRDVVAWIALFVGLLNFGATAFVGHLVMHLPAASQEERAPNSDPGQLAPLDAFVVNLDESGAPRYLKASVSLELSSEPETLSAFEAGKHKIRDLFLRYLSGLKVDDTRGESGKDKIRQDLLARAREELGARRVKDIYFGEFVVQ